MPPIGLGLWKIRDKDVFDRTFEAASAAGYRHFDTAQAYGNEQFLGDCLRKSNLKREDVFITTKIQVQNFGHDKALRSFEDSLAKLQTDYVDLLLLHFPGFSWQRKGSWRALEEIKAAGKAKAIGVSNYQIKHLEAIKSYAREVPTANQVEMHIYLQQRDLLDYCNHHQIQLEAYSPLVHGAAMDDPVVQGIADKHHKSYAQIMLRWCVDVGAVPLPKSTTPARIESNFAIFDFKLDANDMRQLATLDRNRRTVWRSILFG